MMQRWHQTYPICPNSISCFQAKPRHKHHIFHIHSGQLKLRFHEDVKTDVIVFKSQSDQNARDLTAALKQTKQLINQHADLKRCVTVVPAWTRKVESVDYFPAQRKTVEKEDTVVVQERVEAKPCDVVEYDVSCSDVTQLQDHPELAVLVLLSEHCCRGIRFLRAVLKAGVYHITFVSFRCTSATDIPDGFTFNQSLIPTAPEPDVEPTAPEPEVEPTAPEMEPTEAEEDDLPPPYWECMGRIETIRGLPPYQVFEDSPPPYSSVIDPETSLPYT